MTSNAQLAAINARLVETFREETLDGLARLESSLLQLLRGADRALVDELFRVAHTIKGGAGTVGFTAMSRLAHRMESLLDRYRDGAVPVARSVDTLLEGVDALRGQLAAGASAARDEDLEQRLEAHAQTARQVPAPAAAPAITRLRIRPAPHIFTAGVDPAVVLAQLAALDGVAFEADASELPQLADLDPSSCRLSWVVHCGTTSPEVIASLFDWLGDLCSVTPDAAPAAALAAASAPRGARRQAQAAQPAASGTPASIRVRVDKLDALMALIGDLVITESTLSALGHGWHGADRSRGQAALDSLARLTRALQENALQLRSMPIGEVFHRYPRLVHDLASRLGKQIELEIAGEMTELDRAVLERIGDPLLHLLRNSIDHGIELPDVRVAAGKPPTGRIRLSAEHRGGEILIEIADDGKGLDRGRILAGARQRGQVAVGSELSDHEIDQLIFLPGLSTADQLSDISGRGVGMDVVARTIQQLGGNVRLASVPGEGVTISLRLPQSLAIIDGQLVRCGGRTWIVPLPHIVECAVQHGSTQRLGRRLFYQSGEDVIPVVDLCERFQLAPAGATANRLALVVESGGQRTALLVEEIGARQQIVIKSLADQLANVGDLGGAAILGDGSIAFILDVPNLCGVHP